MMPLIYKFQSNLNNHNILQNENYFYFITGETEVQGSHLQTFHMFPNKNYSGQKCRGDKQP